MSRHRPPLWPPLYQQEIVLGCIGIPTYVVAQIALVLGSSGPFGPEVDHTAMIVLGFTYLILLQKIPTRGGREGPPQS
jgi:hypothetical protein